MKIKIGGDDISGRAIINSLASILRQLSVLDNLRCNGVLNESTYASDKRPTEGKKVNNYEKFSSSYMSELVGVLEEKASENPKSVRCDDIDDKGRRKMGAVKTLFTVEGLREFIANVPPEDVYTVSLGIY